MRNKRLRYRNGGWLTLQIDDIHVAEHVPSTPPDSFVQYVHTMYVRHRSLVTVTVRV